MIRGQLGLALRAVVLALLGTPAAPSTASAAARYVTTGGPAQATIVDLTSRHQDEAVLSFGATLLRRAPARLSDMDAYWGDGTLQIDCLGHHTHWRAATGYSLDRTRRFDTPSPAFGAWTDDAEGAVARG